MVQVTALCHHLGRVLRVAAALHVVLCFWQAEAVLGRTVLVVSTVYSYVAPRDCRGSPSQNHRVSQLARDPWGSWSPTPCSSQDLWSFLPVVLCVCSRGGAEALSGMSGAQPWDDSGDVRISEENHCHLGQNAVWKLWFRGRDGRQNLPGCPEFSRKETGNIKHLV